MSRPTTVEVARLVGLRNVFEGRVVSHCRQTGTTVLNWHDQPLEARLQEDFPVGTQVAWSIPAEGVLLMASHRTASDRRDNPVAGCIGKLVMLGDRVRLLVYVRGARDAALAMTVPRHLADRYALTEGQSLALRLRGEHIHLMPAGTPRTIASPSV